MDEMDEVEFYEEPAGDDPLTCDISMGFHSTSAKQGHFGCDTTFVFAQHRVVHRRWGARRRLWGLLPPRVTQKEEYLDIPETVTTVDELWAYVRRAKAYWLYDRQRRDRR